MTAKHFLRGAAVGALFASVATLLLAPKAGKKTRDDVGRLVKSLSEKLGAELEGTSKLSRERYDEIISKTLEEFSKGKQLTKEFVNDLSLILKKYFKEVKGEVSDYGKTVKKAVKKKATKKS